MEEIIKGIFDDIEKYENRYGVSIPIQAYLKIKEKWANLSSKNVCKRFCPICKTKTIHTYHGFKGHNYREVCTICKNWSYAEDD